MVSVIERQDTLKIRKGSVPNHRHAPFFNLITAYFSCSVVLY